MTKSQTPEQRERIEIPALDAICAVALALITHTLEEGERLADFLAWYRRATGDDTMRQADMIGDLARVKDTLEVMGYDFP